MTDEGKPVSARGLPRKRMASLSEETESESETATSSSESETESDSDDSLPSQGSMVVMDAQRPYEDVRVRRREREVGRGSSRRLKDEVTVFQSGSGYSPRPPDTPRSSRYHGNKRSRTAILEVQDEVELNSSQLEGSLQEERRLAVPGDKTGARKRRVIDEGQVITAHTVMMFGR